MQEKHIFETIAKRDGDLCEKLLSEITKISSTNENIFYGEEAFTELVRAGFGSDAATILQHYPYYTWIEFERPNTTEDEHFRNVFHKFNFSSQLLFLLKTMIVT